MKEKDLIKKLNNLKQVKARDEWVRSNREVLLSQIGFGANESGKTYGLGKKLHLFFINIPQPAMAVFLIGAILLGSGTFSIYASRDTKPGDSLYVAKRINEKAKFALTFSEEKKARLGLMFAQNRAVELKSVLEDYEEKEETQTEKKERVANLVENYKKELNFARETIEKINQEKVALGGGKEGMEEKTNLEAGQNEEGEGMVFSANLEKDNKGLDVFDSSASQTDAAPEAKDLVIEDVAIKEFTSSTEEVEIESDSATSTAIIEEKEDDLVKNAENLANQTGELLNQDEDLDTKDLDELAKQADAISAQLDQGEVRGATSSDEVVEEEGGDVASSTEL